MQVCKELETNWYDFVDIYNEPLTFLFFPFLDQNIRTTSPIHANQVLKIENLVIAW